MSFKSTLRPLVPDWAINIYHWKMGFLAALQYGFPAHGLKVVGITGTKGKTTTAYFVESVLRTAGKRVGLSTTVSVGINGTIRPNETKMTTVSPSLLNKRLAEMRQAGCEWIVLETTSHALAQHRVFGIRFDTVLFTNLTHDHLDYHETKEVYRDTKLKLFANHPRVAIANLDDPEGKRFLSLPAERHYGFTLNGRATGKTSGVSEFLTPKVKITSPATIVHGEIIEKTATGTRIKVTTAASELDLTVPIPGDFNVQNALGAIAVGFGLDLPAQTIVKGIEAMTAVPGRMESINKGQPFQVIVDYAHTPDSLKQVFELLKPTAKGRLIHVGGATGDRDRTKRPILGALVGQYADIAIVTDEDPGSEDPMTIMQAVAEGVRRSRKIGRGHLRSGGASGDHSSEVKEAGRGQRPIEGEDFFLIPDRRDAIAKAIDLARKDDLVLITGKGHEEVMVTKTGFIPFSDRQIAAELLDHR